MSTSSGSSSLPSTLVPSGVEDGRLRRSMLEDGSRELLLWFSLHIRILLPDKEEDGLTEDKGGCSCILYNVLISISSLHYINLNVCKRLDKLKL